MLKATLCVQYSNVFSYMPVQSEKKPIQRQVIINSMNYLQDVIKRGSAGRVIITLI